MLGHRAIFLIRVLLHDGLIDNNLSFWPRCPESLSCSASQMRECAFMLNYLVLCCAVDVLNYHLFRYLLSVLLPLTLSGPLEQLLKPGMILTRRCLI